MPRMTQFPRSLMALALIGALAVGCMSISVAPTQSVNPTSPPAASPPPASPAPTDPPAASPQPTDAPTATPAPSDAPTTDPSQPTDPPASVDPAVAAQIEEVMDQVPVVRELEELEDVPYYLQTREDFDAFIRQQDEETVSDDVRLTEERLLKRLGLLPDDASLEELVLELYGGQVAAYYTDEGEMYVIERDEPFNWLDRMFVAHEDTHALQDQHFDITGDRITDLTEGDAALAQLAAIEGDATLTMQQWAVDHLTADELLELLTMSMSGVDDETLAGMPLVLRRQLEFPYVEGFLFSYDVWGQGGYGALNGTLQTDPTSSEQILHPQKYYDGEQPIDVTLEDESATFGEGWTRVYEQTFGELLTQVLATGGEEPPPTLPGLPVSWPHAEAAEGWGGDRLNMYETTDGNWAIVWMTAWDTEADAAEFEARINELAPTFDGATVVTAPSPTERRVVITPDPASLPGVVPEV